MSVLCYTHMTRCQVFRQYTCLRGTMYNIHDKISVVGITYMTNCQVKYDKLSCTIIRFLIFSLLSLQTYLRSMLGIIQNCQTIPTSGCGSCKISPSQQAYSPKQISCRMASEYSKLCLFARVFPQRNSFPHPNPSCGGENSEYSEFFLKYLQKYQ